MGISILSDVSSFTSYSFKPQLKTVGPKYGKQLNGIRTILSELDGNEAMNQLNEKGALTFDVDGVAVELTKEDLLIDIAQTEGFVCESDKGVSVVLDTTLTEELIEEGFVREVVSKIQTMRKEADFEVMDQICVSVSGSSKVVEIVKKNEASIKEDVLATSIVYDQTVGFAKEWKLNEEVCTLGVEKQ